MNRKASVWQRAIKKLLIGGGAVPVMAHRHRRMPVGLPVFLDFIASTWALVSGNILVGVAFVARLWSVEGEAFPASPRRSPSARPITAMAPLP